MNQTMPENKYQERFYRNIQGLKQLKSFRLVVKETDLFIYAEKNLKKKALESVMKFRGYIESYIQLNPEFNRSLVSMSILEPVTAIIREMAEAGQLAKVGPMASVAGAMAENVGKELLGLSGQVVVENGGDIFLKTEKPVVIGVYAGSSPLSLRIGLMVDGQDGPVSICTSSGMFGHSLSMGKADAVCVISDSCALADAAATSIGNRIHSKKDIPGAVEFGKSIPKVKGMIIIKDDEMGMWGDIEVVPLKRRGRN